MTLSRLYDLRRTVFGERRSEGWSVHRVLEVSGRLLVLSSCHLGATVLSVFDAIEGPVVTSGDVAEYTGCSWDSTRRTLERLHEPGVVGRGKTAGHVVYCRYEAEPTAVDPTDPV